MRHLKEIILESKKKDEEKEHKTVFVETDPQEAFPEDCVKYLKRDINKKTKDLETEWKNAVEVVDSAFEDLKVPKPGAYLRKRWEQYLELLSFAVKNLADSRGLKGNWTTT